MTGSPDLMNASVDAETQVELDKLYAGFEAENLAPLWTQLGNLMPMVPAPEAVAHVWRWKTLYDLAQRSGDLVPVGRGGERRAIGLANPGLGGAAYATPTLWCAIQYLGGHETAPEHRHSHVGYNARALTRLIEWANTGVETPMYATTSQRNHEIDFGATLPTAALRNVSAHAAVHLRVEWRDLPADKWTVPVGTAQGRTVPVSETAWMRAREVWLHAIDLDNGGRFSHLPDEFVSRLLPEISATWSTRAQNGLDEIPAVLHPADDHVIVVTGSGQAADAPQRMFRCWIPRCWMLRCWMLRRWILRRWILRRWISRRWMPRRWTFTAPGLICSPGPPVVETVGSSILPENRPLTPCAGCNGPHFQRHGCS